MSDCLYHFSSRVVGGFVVLLIYYRFLIHPLITAAVLVVSIVVGRILWIRSDRREAKAKQEAHDQWMEAWARNAVARTDRSTIRFAHRREAQS